MQRDMKTGLALGLALVGIVGALFFRHDPPPKGEELPPVNGSAELDKQISELPKGPYINGLDEDVTPAVAAATSSTDSAAGPSAGSRSKPEAYETPGFLNKKDQSEHRALQAGRPAVAPDPIGSGASGQPGLGRSAADEPPPAHNRDWKPEGTASGRTGASAQSTGNTASPGGRRTHVIQAGDTLSSLAARYLGSGARYRELYEANRNVLRSPDDLPNGVTLVIPDSNTPPVTPASDRRESPSGSRTHKDSPSAQSTSHETVSTPSRSTSPGPLKFAPVSRGPFSAGRSGGRNPDTGRPSPTPAPEPSGSRERGAPLSRIDDSDPFENE
ncbi:MAG: LysM peptidoglycan-binding domain-containing protein [Planctomycetales bacterium]